MYTFDQLKEDVRKEAEALKVHATKEELGRLDLTTLNPQQYDNCIYGQMTGNCYSERAAELVGACASLLVRDRQLTLIRSQGFQRISAADHARSAIDLFDKRDSNDSHYSAIEAYILLPEAKNESLIAYLKGESETLEL